MPECETAYDTTKGVECYEQVRGTSPLVLQPLSTGITYQIIPKVTEDHIPLHTMGYGRTSAADGTSFEWVFNYPGTYWDAASIIVKYLSTRTAAASRARRSRCSTTTPPTARSRSGRWRSWPRSTGSASRPSPVDSPGQEQKSQWLQIRRERPDYVLMWGWGVMNSVAVTEAASIGFPMDHFIGVWWSGAEPDVLPAGAGADGYKAINFTGVGMDFPFYADLKEHVIDAGKGAGDGSSVGTVQYNRGIFAAMLAAEATRKAQELAGTPDITPSQMRDGMEALDDRRGPARGAGDDRVRAGARQSPAPTTAGPGSG